VRLVLAHPEVAYRPCEMCQLYMFDHESGMVKFDRTGNPMKRPAHSKAPCEYTINAPPGSETKTLSEDPSHGGC